MKEIKDICTSYREAYGQGMRSALATVVHVEGSSYRRPGARMLVTENGQLTGAISGGCLEGDALRKALFAIGQGQNKLITYDTMDEEGELFGIQLGCNGIVSILFEPIDDAQANNPIALLEKLTQQRQEGVLTTLFRRHSIIDDHPGTCLLTLRNEHIISPSEEISCDIINEARKLWDDALSRTVTYDTDSGPLTRFMSYIPPDIALVIAGAGNDAMPLVTQASKLGWYTTLIDGRRTHATQKRFPDADVIHVVKPGESVSELRTDANCAFMLMTHNYQYDLAMLRYVLNLDSFYIGVLGPKKKLELMFSELAESGMQITDKQRQKIFGPAGLDIGAETAEEISLAVTAEIHAVHRRTNSGFLRNKQEAIHSRTDGK